MVKWIRAMVVSAMVFAGASLAQVHPFVEGGSELGVSFGPAGVGFDITMGIGAMNVAGPLGLRGQVAVSSGQGQTSFSVSAGALFSFGSPKRTTDFEPYVGIGFGIISAPNTIFGLLGAVGIEFPVNPKLSFYSEFVPQLFFAGNAVFVGSIKVGVRGYF